MSSSSSYLSLSLSRESDSMWSIFSWSLSRECYPVSLHACLHFPPSLSTMTSENIHHEQQLNLGMKQINAVNRKITTHVTNMIQHSHLLTSLRSHLKKMLQRFQCVANQGNSPSPSSNPRLTCFPWSFLLLISVATYWNELRRKRKLTCKPLIYIQPQNGDDMLPSTDMNKPNSFVIVQSMPSLHREIRPSLFFGTSSVLNSIVGYIKLGPGKRRDVDTKINSSKSCTIKNFQEVMTMPQDGGKIVIEWELPQESLLNNNSITKGQILSGPIPPNTTIVILLHGLNNNASFGYIRSAMRSCTNRGFVAAGVHMRGACPTISLATPRGYNGAYTGDLRSIINQISSRLQDPSFSSSLFLVGYSLGANILVKYLGEEGYNKTLPRCIKGAVSLANPLQIHSKSLRFPWNIILGLGVKKTILANRASFLQSTRGLLHKSLTQALRAPTIGQYDDIMAPHFLRNDPLYPYETTFGYDSGEEYWKDASSFQHIPHVTVPLLQISSLDDFLIRHHVLKRLADCLRNPNVILVNTLCGGHLGWSSDGVEGDTSSGLLSLLFGPSWADKVTVEFIDAILQHRRRAEGQSENIHESESQPSSHVLQSKIQLSKL